MYFGATEPSIIIRQRLEARIVKLVIREALRQGYYMRVDNGEYLVPVNPTRDKTTIVNEIMETDDDYLFFYNADMKQLGWVHFVYGNDGWDVIADYSANPEIESILAPANRYVDKLTSYTNFRG